MNDSYIIGIAVGVISGAIGCIVRAKRKGKKCIGCPNAENCAKKDKEGCNAEEKQIDIHTYKRISPAGNFIRGADSLVTLSV